jgi:hypothetical protein
VSTVYRLRPSFKETTDALGLSAPELAEVLERPTQSIRQMRLDPAHPSYRPPPDGWERVLARIAKERGIVLYDLASALERASREGPG